MNKITQGFDELFNCPHRDTTKFNSTQCEKVVEELLSRNAIPQPEKCYLYLECDGLIQLNIEDYFIQLRARPENDSLMANLYFKIDGQGVEIEQDFLTVVGNEL